MKLIKHIQLKLNKIKRKGISIFLLIFSIMLIMLLLELTVDLGFFLNARYQLQQVVEMATTMTISEFEPYMDVDGSIKYPTDAELLNLYNENYDYIFDTFVAYNNPLLATSNKTSVLAWQRHSKAMRVKVYSTIDTYFLSFLGIKKMNFQAEAAAANVPRPVTYQEILQDATHIESPMGGAMFTYAPDGVDVDMPPVLNRNNDLYNIAGMPDGKALALGPKGIIKFRLSKPITDGKGFDFLIHTRGQSVGYNVYLGNDANPDDPYLNEAHPGSGISWINVSCTSVPINASTIGDVSAYNEMEFYFNAASYVTPHDTVYGSAYFELDSLCLDNDGNPTYGSPSESSGFAGTEWVKSAKYLAIQDDNAEVGFSSYDSMVTPTLPPRAVEYARYFPGQHNSLTPGVNIDSILLLHNAELFSPGDFSTIGASGLITRVQQMYGSQVTDYRRFWGCTNGGDITTITWDNCTSILDSGTSTTTLRMGHSSPNMDPSDPYYKMIISY